MVVVPLSQVANPSQAHPRSAEPGSPNLVSIASGGALVAAGLLLLTGRRRAGLVAAAAGTALAALDQKERVSAWWSDVPVYLDSLQHLLNNVQGTVQQVAIKREKLRRIFTEKTEKPGQTRAS